MKSALAMWSIALVACAGSTPPPPTLQTPEPASPEAAVAPTDDLVPIPDALLEPAKIAEGDVADWPGSWSPDSRFYVFFRWREDVPCTGETVFAYDTVLRREMRLSSDDYCTQDVDPGQIWDGESTLFFGDGLGGNRWVAITLGDEMVRELLDDPPPTCVDRDIPLPPALETLPVARARWSPDESKLAVALTPQEEGHRFGNISGNQPDLLLFERLNLAVFPAEGSSEADLTPLGPIFDLGPDAVGPAEAQEEGCPGTHVRWSDDGRVVISSLGPFAYDVMAGEAWLAPEGPNSGPLGPNIRWSEDDRRVADDQIVLDLATGDQYAPPDILPGFDRGFAGPDALIYVNDAGLAAFTIEDNTVRQLTGFRKSPFVVAPDGTRLVYADGGDLWMLDLSQ